MCPQPTSLGHASAPCPFSASRKVTVWPLVQRHGEAAGWVWTLRDSPSGPGSRAVPELAHGSQGRGSARPRGTPTAVPAARGPLPVSPTPGLGSVSRVCPAAGCGALGPLPLPRDRVRGLWSRGCGSCIPLFLSAPRGPWGLACRAPEAMLTPCLLGVPTSGTLIQVPGAQAPVPPEGSPQPRRGAVCCFRSCPHGRASQGPSLPASLVRPLQRCVPRDSATGWPVQAERDPLPLSTRSPAPWPRSPVQRPWRAGPPTARVSARDASRPRVPRALPRAMEGVPSSTTSPDDFFK